VNIDIHIPEFERLKEGRWFGSLPAALQTLILQRSIVRTYQRDETVFRQGEPCKGLSVVLTGRVRITRRVGDDDEALLHVAGPGFWLGEYALLSGDLTLATVVAAAPARVLVFPAVEFERLVAEDPRRFRTFAGLLFERYVYLHKYLAEGQRLNPAAWLAVRLADMAEVRRLDQHLDGPVTLFISQAELAKMVGVSRQTLNGLLASLAGSGLIEVRFQQVVVLDEPGLRQFSRRGPPGADAPPR
jgi:CRP-like cAMP-binding protein